MGESSCCKQLGDLSGAQILALSNTPILDALQGLDINVLPYADSESLFYDLLNPEVNGAIFYWNGEADLRDELSRLFNIQIANVFSIQPLPGNLFPPLEQRFLVGAGAEDIIDVLNEAIDGGLSVHSMNAPLQMKGGQSIGVNAINPAERAFMAAHPSPRICLDLDYPPYIYLLSDGKLGGYTGAIFSAMEEALGLEFQYSDTPAGTFEQALLEGRCEVSVESRQKRLIEPLVQGRVSYFNTYLVAVGLQGEIPYQRAETIRQLRLGTTAEFLARQFGVDPKTTYIASMNNLIKALQEGEIDAIVHSRERISVLMLASPHLPLSVVAQLEEPFQYVFIAPRDNKVLLDMLDRGLGDLPPDVYDEAYRHALDYAPISEDDYSFLVNIVILLCLLVLLALLGLFIQRRWAVKEKHFAMLQNEFFSNMSHELRTPLNAVFGMLQVLQKTPELPENAKSLVSLAVSSMEDLTKIINNILDYDKLRQGKLTLVESATNLMQEVEQSIEFYRAKAEKKGVRLTLNLPEKFPETVRIDIKRFHQILSNLLSNAIKFTDHGHVSVCIEIRKSQLWLSVDDSGHGMDKLQLSKVFDRFSQGLDPKISANRGSGLGLTIVHELVHLMKGEVIIASELGRGTTVEVILPLAIVAPEVSTSQAAAYSADKNLTGMKVLVAEDILTNQIVIKKMLSLLGVECECVENGQIAL